MAQWPPPFGTLVWATVGLETVKSSSLGYSILIQNLKVFTIHMPNIFLLVYINPS